MVLQAQVSKVERDLLSRWDLDQVDTLAVVSVIIGPVGGDDDAVTVSECAATSRVTYKPIHNTLRGGGASSLEMKAFRTSTVNDGS